MEELKEVRHKLVVLGDSGVGKSAIIARLIYDKFEQRSDPTIGANFMTKSYNIGGRTVVRLDIWDTAG